MITLHHLPNSRSNSIVWLLEELDVPYQTRVVTNIRRADGSGARDPENPHPHAKVPALEHDGQTLFETSAIALYLTDLFPQAGLGPQVGEPARGEYLSWLAYRSGIMEPAFIERRLNIAHVFGMMGWAPPEEVEEVVNRHLQNRPYFLGDRFSAADIVLGGGIHLMIQFKLMTQTDLLAQYCARITDRPAYKRSAP